MSIKNKTKSISAKDLYDYYKYYNDMQKKGYTMATGGQLKVQNNSGMNPYLYNSLPQYGLGSWFAENAGTIGTVAGGILGSVIPVVGAPLGASIGGSIGGMISNRAESEKLRQEQLNEQQRQVGTQNAMDNYNAQKHPMYGTNFATGGRIPNVNTLRYGNVGAMNYGHNSRRLNNDNRAAQMTKGLDGITVYPKSAGTHQSNPYGGITIGRYGQTEGDEVRVGKYIFSNRF